MGPPDAGRDKGGSSPRAFRESVSLRRLDVRLRTSRMMSEYISVLRRAAPGHWYLSVHTHHEPAGLCRVRHGPCPLASLAGPSLCPAFGDSHKTAPRWSGDALMPARTQEGVGLQGREGSGCAFHCQLHVHGCTAEPLDHGPGRAQQAPSAEPPPRGSVPGSWGDPLT